MMKIEALPARASTHAFCVNCRDITPTVDRPLAERSVRQRRGFEGATLHCAKCDVQHVTIYVAEEVGRHVVDSATHLS